MGALSERHVHQSQCITVSGMCITCASQSCRVTVISFTIDAHLTHNAVAGACYPRAALREGGGKSAGKSQNKTAEGCGTTGHLCLRP